MGSLSQVEPSLPLFLLSELWPLGGPVSRVLVEWGGVTVSLRLGKALFLPS